MNVYYYNSVKTYYNSVPKSENEEMMEIPQLAKQFRKKKRLKILQCNN